MIKCLPPLPAATRLFLVDTTPSQRFAMTTPEERRRFATTHWTVVLAAGDQACPDFEQALKALCETYWYPVYAYVRRRGFRIHDAEELTQEFFTRLLEKNYVRDADRKRGKFRTFLLTAVKNFLSKERDRDNTKKRGGGRIRLSLDFEKAEGRYTLEPVDGRTAEDIFERRWAFTFLEDALRQLREWYEKHDKQERFEGLKEYLEGDGPPYLQKAAELGMKEPAVRQEVSRLRKRCREFLRNQIADTVATPADIDEELRSLLQAMKS